MRMHRELLALRKLMTLLCGSLYAHRSTHLKKAIFLFRLCHLTVAIISYLRPKRKADEKFPPIRSPIRY